MLYRGIGEFVDWDEHNKTYHQDSKTPSEEMWDLQTTIGLGKSRLAGKLRWLWVDNYPGAAQQWFLFGGSGEYTME